MNLNRTLSPHALAALTGQSAEALTLPDMSHNNDPWYIQAVIGFGAWLASLFLFLGTSCIVSFSQDHWQIVVRAVGLGFLIAGGMLHWQAKGVFARQFSLALLLGGQAALCFSFVNDQWDDERFNLLVITLVSALCTGGFIWLIRDSVLQFVSASATVLLAVAYLFPFTLDSIYGPQLFSVFCCLSGSTLLLWPTPRVNTRPLGVVLLLHAATGLIGQELAMRSLWLIDLRAALDVPLLWLLRASFLGALLLPLVDDLRGRAMTPATFALIGLGAALVLFVNPASLAALLLVMIAWRSGAVVFAGLGIALQIALIIWQYYDLAWSLMNKGLSLILSGVVLLVGGWLWLKQKPAGAPNDA